jgi:CO dehydrogenase/acetyl-CoA synthase beta subunit
LLYLQRDDSEDDEEDDEEEEEDEERDEDEEEEEEEQAAELGTKTIQVPVLSRLNLFIFVMKTFTVLYRNLMVRKLTVR